MTYRYETYTFTTTSTSTVRRFRTESAAITTADRASLGAYVIQVRTDGRGIASHTVTYRTGVAV
jgi:hypothetical protein